MAPEGAAGTVLFYDNIFVLTKLLSGVIVKIDKNRLILSFILEIPM